MAIAVIINVKEGDQVLALVDMEYLAFFDEVVYTARLQGDLYKGIKIDSDVNLRGALANATKVIHKVREDNVHSTNG